MNHKFHFALSFSGSCRDQARDISDGLQKSGYRVFFDEWYEHEMLGKDGAEYLRNIYGKDSKYCIILIDKEYDERKWTKFEKEVIESRTFGGSKDTLIPLLMDGHHPEWLPATRIYYDYNNKGLKGIVALLLKKLPLRSNADYVSYSPSDKFEHDLVICKKSDNKPSVLIINSGGNAGYFNEKRVSEKRPSRWNDFEKLSPHFSVFGFEVDMVTYTPPITSENTQTIDWKEIAKTIELYYEEYAGFVVLHDTDTLAYTASALSFVLNNLDKPIILTHSMIPAYAKRTDAIQNIASSIEFAGYHISGGELIPEVVILSGSSLFRGNRSKVISSSSFHAIDSPNFPALGHIGESIQLNLKSILKVPSDSKIVVNGELSENVVTLSLFPGFKNEFLDALIEPDNHVEGIVLEVYSMSISTKELKFGEFLRKCRLQKIPVVIASSKNGGFIDQGLFEQYLSNGLMINAYDMTVEAALAKLSYALGHRFPYDKVALFMQSNVSGEITLPK